MQPISPNIVSPTTRNIAPFFWSSKVVFPLHPTENCGAGPGRRCGQRAVRGGSGGGIEPSRYGDEGQGRIRPRARMPGTRQSFPANLKVPPNCFSRMNTGVLYASVLQCCCSSQALVAAAKGDADRGRREFAARRQAEQQNILDRLRQQLSLLQKELAAAKSKAATDISRAQVCQRAASESTALSRSSIIHSACKSTHSSPFVRPSSLFKPSRSLLSPSLRDRSWHKYCLRLLSGASSHSKSTWHIFSSELARSTPLDNAYFRLRTMMPFSFSSSCCRVTLPPRQARLRPPPQ